MEKEKERRSKNQVLFCCKVKASRIMGEIEELEEEIHSEINTHGHGRMTSRLRSTEEAGGDHNNKKKEKKEEEEEVNMAEITLKTIGPSPSSRLLVPSCIKVCDLRKMIADNNHLPIKNLRLILHGNVLHDTRDEEDVHLQLNDGDSLIVAVKPKPPAKHLRDEYDFEDDDLKFRLPPSTSRWKRRLYLLLHDKLKLPDIILMAIFSLTLKAWAVIILWFILAPVAHRWELGPIYILGTGFLVIFLNLGRRQAGDLSAYSIFNEGFRELPGTLNADHLDRDIRAGQF